MTHSNHRRGDRESLKNDYVVLAMMSRAATTPEQRKILEPGFKKMLAVLAKYNPVCLTTSKGAQERFRYIKGWKDGCTIKDILEVETPRSLTAVFDNKESLKKALMEVKKADLGLSVVVSGIFDEVFDVCKTIGVGPHTANMSGETWGRTELLPDEGILELTTMCGHALVSQNLTRHLIDRVRKGRMTALEAGAELSRQCACGIYNPVRAAKLIEKYIATHR
jgi:hypothetical protein